MISSQAKEMKRILFQNKDLQYLLNTPIHIQRKDWEDCASLDSLPMGVTVEKIANRLIDGEIIRNKTSSNRNVILYFHGGGLTMGSSKTHRKLASHLAKVSNIPVLVYDYPLAPEHPYPAALNASKGVYVWLLEKGYKAEQIIFGGDSSGCALALSLLLKLRDEHYELPKCAFLFSPMLDFTLSGNTIKTLANIDPCLFEEDMRLSVSLYINGAKPEQPFITPLNGSFKDFPPMLIQVGSSEMLLDDALLLKEKATSEGGNVCLEIWDEMWHVFQGKVGEIPEADQALRNVNSFIEKYNVMCEL